MGCRVGSKIGARDVVPFEGDGERERSGKVLSEFTEGIWTDEVRSTSVMTRVERTSGIVT